MADDSAAIAAERYKQTMNAHAPAPSEYPYQSEMVDHHPLAGNRSVEGSSPAVLADIYDESINIAVWQRELAATLTENIAGFIAANPRFKTSMTVTAKSVHEALVNTFGTFELDELRQDISELVDMYCTLFEIKRVGLRLSALDYAMCPKFHVDHVPCRLVTTYQGVSTEWLPHELADRSKLGRGSNGLADSESGLYQSDNDIQRLTCGDVGLLKGERWEGNEGAGLIHRSPSPPDSGHRLLLTLDLME